jgi:hypothetical protein
MRPLRALVPLILVATACSSSTGNDFGGSDPGKDDAKLVLRISYEGGFVPPEFTLKNLPFLNVYADGRVIVEGAQIEIYPQPATVGLFQRTLSERGLSELRKAAVEAGLTGPDRRYDYPLVADASDTVFVYVDEDGERHEIRVYAMGMGEGLKEPGSDIPAEDQQARERLAEFQSKVTDLDNWLGDEVGPETGYEPHALRVFAKAYEGDPELPQESVEWPLDTSLATFGEAYGTFGYRCGTVDGDAKSKLQAELRNANTLTPWTDAGAEFTLVVRPLLPDESGCPEA